MTISENLDESVKKKYSLYFRGIVILYAIAIVIRFYKDFNVIYTIGIFIAYVLLFFLFRKKIKWFRLLRLINDFAFIILVGYQVGVLNAELTIFILLPLINALNHTHDSIRKSFSIQLYILTATAFYIINHFKNDFTFLLPIIAISLVNLVIAIRMFLNKCNNKLDNVIESFYSNKQPVFKIYKILLEIIETINTDIYLKKLIKINRISFYKLVKNHSPNIIASSSFIYNFKFEGLPETEQGYFAPVVKGKINNGPIENGIGLKITSTSNGTNFILIESKNKIGFLLPLLIEKIFIPVFIRVAHINSFEQEISSMKKKYFEKTKREFENIDAAANAVHFLANKLTPVTNYFTMAKDLKNDVVPVDKIDEWVEIMNTDFKRANQNIKSIQRKMMQIAQYTSSSHSISEFENLKIDSFITYLRTIFINECFLPFDIVVNMNELTQDKTLIINMTALDFVFSELIENFNKHAIDEIQIDININMQDSIFSLTTINKISSYSNSETRRLMNDYIKDFNEGEVNELLQRKGNKGIKFLKQFLNELKVNYSCKNVDDSLYINLKFHLS